MNEIKLLASEWLQLAKMKSLFSVKSVENMKSPILFSVLLFLFVCLFVFQH